MKKKPGSDTQTDDLHLLALLVTKRLRELHDCKQVPNVGDYRIADSKVYSQIGKEVQIALDVGRGLKVTVYDAWFTEAEAGIDLLICRAEGLADKIAETWRDAGEVRAIVAEVTTAAKREIAKAKRRGLSYELTSVTVPPLRASSHDQGVARVEHQALGRSLRMEPFAFHAECAADVVRAFANIADEQQGRAKLRAASTAARIYLPQIDDRVAV